VRCTIQCVRELVVKPCARLRPPVNEIVIPGPGGRDNLGVAGRDHPFTGGAAAPTVLSR
jgi:hypothetical protein